MCSEIADSCKNNMEVKWEFSISLILTKAPIVLEAQRVSISAGNRPLSRKSKAKSDYLDAEKLQSSEMQKNLERQSVRFT